MFQKNSKKIFLDQEQLKKRKKQKPRRQFSTLESMQKNTDYSWGTTKVTMDKSVEVCDYQKE